MTQDYTLGPRIETGEHYALLRHVLTLEPKGIAVEFGVGKGESTAIIAEHMPVLGFDSFQGLPEDWRDGYPKGSFAQGRAPDIANAHLIVGLFSDTLPGFDWPDIGLVHFDADLYSSTATALEHLGPHLRPGTFIVFDEWHGYDRSDQHEQRAWREFADRIGVGWTVIGHGHEAWSLQIA